MGFLICYSCFFFVFLLAISLIDLFGIERFVRCTWRCIECFGNRYTCVVQYVSCDCDRSCMCAKSISMLCIIWIWMSYDSFFFMARYCVIYRSFYSMFIIFLSVFCCYVQIRNTPCNINDDEKTQNQNFRIDFDEAHLIE